MAGPSAGVPMVRCCAAQAARSMTTCARYAVTTLAWSRRNAANVLCIFAGSTKPDSSDVEKRWFFKDNNGAFHERWVKMTRDMIDKAKLAMAAARAHNKDQIVETGGNLNTTCDNCHEKYQRE